MNFKKFNLYDSKKAAKGADVIFSDKEPQSITCRMGRGTKPNNNG